MKHPFAALGALAWLVACSSPPADPAGAPEQLGMRNYAAPLPDIHTSGQPTPEQFALLSKAGIRRVIQLRPATEQGTGWEEAAAQPAGVTFVRLPIDGKDGLTRANVERFAAELAAGGGAPTLVCCGSSNRVGGLFALKAGWLDGKSADEALTIGRSAGLKALEDTVKQLLQDQPPK